MTLLLPLPVIIWDKQCDISCYLQLLAQMAMRISKRALWSDMCPRWRLRQMYVKGRALWSDVCEGEGIVIRCVWRGGHYGQKLWMRRARCSGKREKDSSLYTRNLVYSGFLVSIQRVYENMHDKISNTIHAKYQITLVYKIQQFIWYDFMQYYITFNTITHKIWRHL